MEILKRQYAGRDDLTEFVIPEGVAVIGEYAFADCKNLQKVTIPGSVEYIAAYAVPKLFEFIDEMPMTKVGKVAYTELEKMDREQREKA